MPLAWHREVTSMHARAWRRWRLSVCVTFGEMHRDSDIHMSRAVLCTVTQPFLPSACALSLSCIFYILFSSKSTKNVKLSNFIFPFFLLDHSSLLSSRYTFSFIFSVAWFPFSSRWLHALSHSHSQTRTPCVHTHRATSRVWRCLGFKVHEVQAPLFCHPLKGIEMFRMYIFTHIPVCVCAKQFARMQVF